MVEAGFADFQRIGAVIGDLDAVHRLAHLDVAGDLVVLLLVDDAADVGGLIAGIADLHLRHRVYELGQEVVVDVLVEEQARTHGARLTLAGEAGRQQDLLEGVVVVRVREDDVRGLAAELHRRMRESTTGQLGDVTADARRSGE